MIVLGIAAADVGDRWFDITRHGGGLGVMIGTSLRAFVQHRAKGPLLATLWAAAYAGASLAAYVALVYAAALLTPPPRGLDLPWALLLAGGVTAVAVSALLSERDPRVRLAVAAMFASLGLILAGLLGPLVGPPWVILALPLGLMLFVAALAVAHQARRRQAAKE